MPSSEKALTTDAAFEDHFTYVKEEAEKLIKKEFPKKIRKLTELLKSPEFNYEYQRKLLRKEHSYSAIQNDDQDGDTSKANGHSDFKSNGSAKESNKDQILNTDHSSEIKISSTLERLQETAKPYFREMNEEAELLRMWITLLIPKIEDGNNLGVEIQEIILRGISSAESESGSYLSNFSVYLGVRGKYASKITKYPHVEDYRRWLLDYDENEIYIVRSKLSELRNHYVTLYDMISKNWEKIVNPRTSHVENLY